MPEDDLLRLYLDESYHQEHYYMAGVVVTPEQQARLTGELDDVAAHAALRFGVDPDIEWHAHRLMHGASPWECMRGRVHEAVSLYRHAMRAIRSSGARILVEGLDVGRLRRRYRYPDPPYEIVLRRILEQVNELTMRDGRRACSVRADLVSRHADFREAIEGYTRVGAPVGTPRRLDFIEQPIEWIDSEGDRGIQAADLVVYMYRRVHEPHHRENARVRRAARSILRELGPIHHERKWSP
ncbi:DUF3800 domain-containing protein [Rothia sp. AR01]|uniref:DUF3800 domain-containing protein n=1 Tax=Rothia santali TaxID=2949643 RepID=A0A9X2HGL0_9MICC|nr:DUF3800 domain-containing protein [Rothia santali]MCP3425341.1 DUF3800 domain-containing protein [Rothia santali]